MKILNLSISIFLVVLSGCGDSQNQDQGTPFALGEPYARAVMADNGSGHLEMSAKTFLPANGSGPKVTLMGMIHIGESSFYSQVQERIHKSNMVFLEAIGGNPEGDGYLISAMFIPACKTLETLVQHENSAGALGLVHQSLIYPKEKAVWADLGLEPLLDQFLRTPFALGKRSKMPNSAWDSKCYQVLWLFQEGLKENPSHDLAKINLLAEPASLVQAQILDYSRLMTSKLGRKNLALSLVSPSRSSQEIFPGFEEVLLERRNDVVLQKLAQRLNMTSGEILIVYGAAHMPDIEKRFTRELNYTPGTEQRLVAFNF